MYSPDAEIAEVETAGHERRISLAAALTLGCVMAAHVLLETAGDALFLANIAVEHLPFVTIAVALLAVAASKGPVGDSHRVALIALQVLAAIGTIGLWSLVVVAEPASWVFYLLYIWPSLVTILVVVRFWLLLGEHFTITQGKRLYASIAMGGSFGALIGSGAAALLAQELGGESLLLASGTLYAASALGPLMMSPAGVTRHAATSSEESERQISLFASLRRVLESPYACRVAALAVAASVTLTLGDYLFKSVMAAEIEAERLPVILSQIYLALNLLSISMLALGVTPLVRRMGVDRALSVLPAMIGLGAVGVLAGGAFAATIFMKAADGTLRYSLHKTTTELLYLPMSSKLRNSVKGAIDIVGQAAGKAGASLLILGLVVWPHSRMIVAAAVVVAASLWAFGALRLRRAYLDNFRSTLSEGSIVTAIEHPELDLDSVGSLIRALSDPDERRALAAIRLLNDSGRLSLIPSLVLYHPSPSVVVHALDAFALAQRDDFSHLLGHLLEHENPDVRAASVRASWVLDRDIRLLRGLETSECLAIRVSAAAGLVALGEDAGDFYRRTLEEVVKYETSEARLAAAMAARLHYHPLARDALFEIAQDDDPVVAREAIEAIRASGDASFTEPLVSLLGDRRIREEVRVALIERKAPALAVLSEQLVSPETPIAVLRHIPQTIARFGTVEAANVLIDSLSVIEGGMVRYKILRGLETLKQEIMRKPAMERRRMLAAIDAQGIRNEFDRTLARSMELLRIEAILSRVSVLEPDKATPVGKLLIELLADKRELATDRLFSILGLLYPREDFGVIQMGLESTNPNDRASAAELIETLLPSDDARELLGLAWPGRPEDRLARAQPERVREAIDYAAAVRQVLKDSSYTVRAVALYHADEVCLDCVAQDLPDELFLEDDSQGGKELMLKSRALDLVRGLSSRKVQPLVSALTPK